jgi:hypothetical protein
MIADKIHLTLDKSVSSYITYDFEIMNNTHINNSNTKVTKISNSLYLLSLAFIVVINFESVSTFSYYLENFVNEKSMVMQL